ncbi:unnamed protein product [Alternaria alternata]
MAENKYSQRISRRTWDLHKDNILRLYVAEKKPLNAVKDLMHSEYGFSATVTKHSDQDLFSTTLHSTSIFAKSPLPQLFVDFSRLLA